MTRSDLINSLGVGSRLSHDALLVARFLAGRNIVGGDDDDNDGNDDGGVEEKEDDATASTDDDEDDDDDDDEEIAIPCKSKDIGSFYSAFCSLGSKIEIGTKVCIFFVCYEQFFTKCEVQFQLFDFTHLHSSSNTHMHIVQI